MSMPNVPGFLGEKDPVALGDLWVKPEGDLPEALWPAEILDSVIPTPVGWVTVAEHFFEDEAHGGRSCVLAQAKTEADLLAGTSWIGRNLGEVGVFDSGRFDDGLRIDDRGLLLDFFAQGRTPVGADEPILEISRPFLWYFDAFQVGNDWRYLNRAGRDRELVRCELSAEAWRIEVRALEFRQFLFAYERCAVVQIDFVPKLDAEPFDRVDSEFKSEWATFDLSAVWDDTMSGRPAFSRLLGRYLIEGASTDGLPRFEERHQDSEYPDFVYGLDPHSGTALKHTCDPDQLGTYFDEDSSRLHYLTPVYFDPLVLQPYQAEPNRYTVTSGRLSCLSLWGVDISFNRAGQVEVYLGDIGRDLPSDEWGRWLAHNVPPEGQMEEGRFRRDFLNRIGRPVWRALDEEVSAEFDGLVGPLSNDKASLGPPLLLLAKVFVDGIDPRPLKNVLGDASPDEKSLSLLRRYLDSMDGGGDLILPLKELQDARSRGGIAHLGGSSRRSALAKLGVADLEPRKGFEVVIARLTECLGQIVDLVEAGPSAKWE